MKDSEFHNFFKIAESRNISTVDVAEMLILNGRQIYLHFIKAQLGTLLFEGFKKVEKPITYKIESGKVYPITPDSRIDLVSAFSEKKKNAELKVRINWEESENENHGYFIVKVKVNLMDNLVIDYEDLRFLPPLPNIGRGLSGSDMASPAKFFTDNFFHQLVLRTMKKEGKDWNTVKRNLRKHTLEGEQITIAGVSNFEGEMRNQIQFKKEGYIEPYRVMESTFQKKLTAYRKHLQ